MATCELGLGCDGLPLPPRRPDLDYSSTQRAGGQRRIAHVAVFPTGRLSAIGAGTRAPMADVLNAVTSIDSSL